jgi:hypothetical protein
VSPRTKALLYLLIAVGWLALGLVNLARDHPGLGVLYIVLGTICAGLALTVQMGRRSR